MQGSQILDIFRHDPAKATILGLILIGLILLFMEWWDALAGNAGLNFKPASTPVQKRETSVQKEAIKGSIFGLYLPPQLSQVKESTLNFEVVGIMFSHDKDHSQAIIKTASGEEAVYFVNDSLPGNVVIKKISPDGILVLHNGALESLNIKKSELQFLPPPQPLKD